MENVLVKQLYPTVAKSLSNRQTVKKLITSMQKYFDMNSEVLFNSIPSQKLFFKECDKQAIYDASSLDPKHVKDIIKTSNYIKEKWQIMNEPLNTSSALVARYFAINKEKENLIIFLTFYGCYFYTSLFHKYLPYGANESIMEYTVNELSNKFLIKQLGSVFKCIQHIVSKSHETYEKELLRGNDGDLALYISAIKVRLNDFLKNIKNEYTINHNNDKFVNYDSDSYDEDDFHMTDNNSFAIKRIAEASRIKLTTYGPELKLARISAHMSQVSESEVRNVIINLSENETDSIFTLCEFIINLYLLDNENKPDEIRSNKFLKYSLEVYKKSNTNDQIIIDIKEILDLWLKKYSDKYRKTNREATLSNFRKAIFTYFVLHIQQSA